MSEPLSGSGTAAALGGATVFGLFTGTDFGIVFGAFAGALFVATMPQALSAWRVAAHFLVSFIVGVRGCDNAGVRVCANDNCSHFHGSSRWGTLATGRERRGKRLVFEILFGITTTVID